MHDDYLPHVRGVIERISAAGSFLWGNERELEDCVAGSLPPAFVRLREQRR